MESVNPIESGAALDGWERLSGEPTRWHERFEVYRSLGPERTIAQAYRIYAARIGLKGKKPDKDWYRIARRWGWRERAALWDDAERRRLRADEQQLRTRAYYERVRAITSVLRDALKVFAAADLENLSRNEARELLPVIRPLFREMLGAYREEVAKPDANEPKSEPIAPTKEAPQPASRQIAPFSADELGRARQATRELLEAEDRRPQGWRIAPGSAWGALRAALSHLYPDRASTARVAEEAGLDITRIDLAGSPLSAWEAVLREARRIARLDALLNIAAGEYGSYSLLRDARDAWERDRVTLSG